MSSKPPEPSSEMQQAWSELSATLAAMRNDCVRLSLVLQDYLFDADHLGRQDSARQAEQALAAMRQGRAR